MKLYNYFRSSASYRVRIALALKGLAYDYLPVHLLKREQLEPAFTALSPAQLVPVLVVDGDDDGDGGELVLTQALAIVEYLDETHPDPPLLPPLASPNGAAARARVRALAQTVACEIHPLNNLRVLRYLVGEMKLSEDDKNRWYRHWVESGLAALEAQRAVPAAAGRVGTGRFCHGDSPTLADIALVPQIFNAQRLDCRLDHVPTVMRVFDACLQLDAFSSTQPSACPDAS